MAGVCISLGDRVRQHGHERGTLLRKKALRPETAHMRRDTNIEQSGALLLCVVDTICQACLVRWPPFSQTNQTPTPFTIQNSARLPLDQAVNRQGKGAPRSPDHLLQLFNFHEIESFL